MISLPPICARRQPQSIPGALIQPKMRIFPVKPTIHSYGTLLFICCAIAFASYFGSYLRIPVVPLFARELGATTTEVGLINAAFLVMSGLLSFPLGIVSDRWGRKSLITGGLLISLGTSLLLYFSATPRQLIWIYLLFGAGLAAVGPTLMSYVADISPPTHLGRSYGWYTTAIYTGMTVGPAAGGLLAHLWGYRPLFLIAGAFMLLVVLLEWVYLPDSRPPAESRSQQEKGWGLTKDFFKNRALLGCLLLTLGGCFGQGMFVTFVPLYAQDQGLNIGQIGLVFALQAVANAVSRLPLGRLSDMVASRGRLAALGFTSFGIALAAVGLAHTLTHFILTAIILGFAMGLSFVPLGALVAETVPPQSRGLAMGGYNSCIYLGMMLSSALMGGVIQGLGFAGAYFLAGGLTLLVTGVFYLMIRDFSPAGEMKTP